MRIVPRVGRVCHRCCACAHFLQHCVGRWYTKEDMDLGYKDGIRCPGVYVSLGAANDAYDASERKLVMDGGLWWSMNDG
jgi:hypothetical protein